MQKLGTDRYLYYEVIFVTGQNRGGWRAAVCLTNCTFENTIVLRCVG